MRETELAYAHVYADALGRLRQRAPDVPLDEVQAAARSIAGYAWRDIERRRLRRRKGISRDTRRNLWFAAEPAPRCYLCGYLFPDWARDRLLGESGLGTSGSFVPPLIVDFTRPRATQRDFAIEVDHVTSVAVGGGSYEGNLRLACGWCNRVKSDRRNLYDAPAGYTGAVTLADLGHMPVPQPLWVLRLVATRGRCEAASDCTAAVHNSELFVAGRPGTVVLNPTSALVCCPDHDPWRTARYVGRTAVVSRP